MAFPPHVDDERIAGEDRRRKAGREAREPFGIPSGKAFDNRAAGDAVGTQAMQDGAVESGAPGGVGIDVQWINVTAQPVDQSEVRSEGKTSELKTLMRITYAVLCL